MINVLYIVNESEAGGAAQSLLDMLTVGRKRICAVVIIPSEGSIEERLQQMNIDYYVVPFKTDHRKIGTHTTEETDTVFASNYAAALKLQDIIKQNKIELIHTNSSVSNVGAIAALMADIPHIWHIRELLEEHYGFEFLDKALKKELFACSDKIITISNYVKNVYMSRYGFDSICIYNGVNSDRFLSKGFDMKEEHCFMLAGAISPQKGQADAVKAAHEVIRNGIDIQLYIVGTGNYQYGWLLKKYVKEYGLERNIHFLDFKNNLRQLREKCLYSITASKMEALGRVTIESMMAGCIVIGADTGGTAEIIGQDCRRGYLYRQGDYKDLARVMQYALEHRENNVEIQKTAQNYSVEMFDVIKYLENIVKMYEDLTRRNEISDRSQKAGLLEQLSTRYGSLQDRTGYVYDSGGFGKQQAIQKTVQRWLRNKLEHKLLDTVLVEKEIYSIAIYGMGYLGCCLYDELEGSRVTVEYVMDRRITDPDGLIKIVDLQEMLPEVDAIVVTVLGEVEALIDHIKAKCSYTIVMLSELLEWCENI
ncbi:MAG: glycosyltransferase family 4 protein [Lachnospiraceae bacterium]|jgi:glycosyltransferase involved in cell wall biosynthesis|nr:glycosyltransferase family 4 protein [Lachnospiraceae bacterium]